MEHGPRRAGQFGAAIERIELAIIGPHIDRAVRADGRGGFHITPREVGPLEGAVRIDRIELAIIGPDIDHPIRADGWGGARSIPGGVGPLQGAVHCLGAIGPSHHAYQQEQSE